MALPKSLYPEIVIHFDNEEQIASYMDQEAGQEDMYVAYDRMYIELTKVIGESILIIRKDKQATFYIMSHNGYGALPFFKLANGNTYFYGLDGKRVTPNLKDQNAMSIAQRIYLATILYINSIQKDHVSINTETRNRPSIYTRIGDTYRFAKVDHLSGKNSPKYQKPLEPTGIKKKHHHVRGHWRTYKSGVKVWVKAHERGDPDLGHVTRILKI